MGLTTTNAICEAVRDALQVADRVSGLPPLGMYTIDHYNMKETVLAIEMLLERDDVKNIVDTPDRICIEVLESGMLPLGRFLFYNGVGGALADMIGHLLQPLRALLGYATIKELTDDLKIVEVRRAQYDLPGFVCQPFTQGPIDKVTMSTKLASDTETFGVIKCVFKKGPWKRVPVYIRTGKGFFPQSKTVIVEKDGARLLVDIDRNQILLRNSNQDPQLLWPAATRAANPAGSPLPPTKSDEYWQIFAELCTDKGPCPQHFPGIEEAVAVVNWCYIELLKHRKANPDGLETYRSDYSGEPVRQWFADEACWE